MVFRRGSGNFLGILGRRGLITLQTDSAVLRAASRARAAPALRMIVVKGQRRRVKKIGKKYGTQK